MTIHPTFRSLPHYHIGKSRRTALILFLSGSTRELHQVESKGVRATGMSTQSNDIRAQHEREASPQEKQTALFQRLIPILFVADVQAERDFSSAWGSPSPIREPSSRTSLRWVLAPSSSGSPAGRTLPRTSPTVSSPGNLASRISR